MNNFKIFLKLVIGALILMTIGFYNGYPLVYSDTGTYLSGGFDYRIPAGRPITYGLFVRFFSFGCSLWPVIFVQNLVTAFVIYEVIRTIGFKTNFNLIFFSTLTFLMAFTGIGWYTNQIMPDFFTPILILTIYLLITGEHHNLVTKIFLSALLIFSTITHFSHLIIGLGLVSFLSIAKIILKRFLIRHRLNFSTRKVVFVSALVLSGFILLPGINYLVERKFILSKASHVFLMAHLNDTGILEKFLKENCSDNEFKNCKLCQYKDSLPVDVNGFLWADTNIPSKTGGWQNSRDEYNRIIKATFFRPKYLFLNCYKSFTYGLTQLTRNEIGQGLRAYNAGSAPYRQIRSRFHDELNNYLNSRQNKMGLKFDTLNQANLLLLVSCLLIFIYLICTPLWRKLDSKTSLLGAIIMAGIIINSFFTSGLNSPFARFQARVVWMLPLALILLLWKNYKIIQESTKQAVK